MDLYKQNFRIYSEKPIIFHSVFEHNANLIPWRESGAHIVMIPMSETGDFNYEYLQQKLNDFKDRNTIKIGTFIAGTNIAGTVFDVDRIAVMCHKAGFLAFFDYAATAPYQDINMNGITNHGFRKD